MSTRVVTRPAVGVDIALDLSRTAVATATRQDGLIRIQLAYLPGADNAREVAQMAGRSQVVLSVAGPADVLTEPLKKKVRLVELDRRAAELAENNFAIELFKAEKARVRLPDDPILKDAVKHARTRRTRAGNLLDKLLSGADLYPFTACAFAYHGVTRGASRAPRIYNFDANFDVDPALREKWRLEDEAW